MTIFKKRLLLLLFTLFAAVCLGLGLIFMPSEKSKAEETKTLDNASYFNIDSNGVFNGLTAEGIREAGRLPFTIVLPVNVTAIGDGNARPSSSAVEVQPTENLLFGSATQYLKGIKFSDDGIGKIKSIGYRAFVNCTSLTEIDLGGMTALDTISGGAFRGCSELAEVTLPSGIAAVPADAFRGCSKLKSVTMQGSVLSIGASAFYACTSLPNITLPASVSTIGESAFYNCTKLDHVNIPSGVSVISARAFENCTNLKGVNSENSGNTSFDIANVTNIGDRAFYGCSSLREVTVPTQVTSIGLNAFFGLEDVMVINYYAAAASSQSGPFAMTDVGYGRASVVVNIGSVTQPAVTVIPQGLFTGHKAVKEVTFNNVSLQGGETDYGANAFSNCISLTKVTFGANCEITVINSGAFSGCTALHTVSGIENIGLSTIGSNVFYNCRSLYSIAIGAEVQNIHDGAFTGCTKLIEVNNLSANLNIAAGNTGNGGVAAYAKNVYGVSGGSTKLSKAGEGNNFVFYSDGVSEALLVAYIGSATRVELPGKFSGNNYSVYDTAFIGNSSMTVLTVPDGVQKIGNNAFESCLSLNSVELSNGLKELGTGIFMGCTALESVNFKQNSSLSVISENMFRGCTSLRTITLPKGINNINANAFNGCTQLVIVSFTESSDKTYSLQGLSGGAFAGCTSLAAIALPASVQNVRSGCFSGCTNLNFVYLPPNANVAYESNVFENCSPDLVLISVDKNNYALDKNETNLKDFVKEENFTYPVDVNLFYEDEYTLGDHYVQRLFGMPGDWELAVNNLSWLATGRMPRQGQDGEEGIQQYAFSEWFKERAFITHVDVDEFTRMLAVDGVESITLYARYYTHPDLIAYKHLEYEVGGEYSIKDILMEIFQLDGSEIEESNADKLLNTFSFSIVSHKYADGTDDVSWLWSYETKIKDAGKYVVRVTLPTDGSYGVWSDYLELEFTVDPATINIDEYIVWKPLNGELAPEGVDSEGNLVKSSLYFYDETPYLEMLSDGTDGNGDTIYEKPTSTVEVSASYTIFSEKEIRIKLEWLSSAFGEIVESSYINNFGTAAGTYKAQVRVKPYNNYKLSYSTDSATSQKHNLLGLQFDPQIDGSMIISKTWYIVLSDANQLLSSNAGGGLYNIPSSWDYKDGSKIPSAPELSKINDSSLITFTFVYTDPQGEVIDFSSAYTTGRISVSNYDSYMNAMMPAGDYVITFYVADTHDDQGRLVAGNGAGGKTFTFHVNEIPTTETDRTDVRSKLKDTDVAYDSSKALNFIDTDSIALLNPTTPSKPQANTINYAIWRNYMDKYYTPFTIRYFVVLGNTHVGAPEHYYTVEEYLAGGSDMVKPQGIGSYTVYYTISAPNFSGVIEGSYKLNITYTLRPVLPDFEYQGSSVLGSVVNTLNKMGNEYFEIYTMLNYAHLDPSDLLATLTKSADDGLRINHMYNGSMNDSYSGVGTHYIFLKIKSDYSSYILWDTSAETQTVLTGTDAGKYYVLPVEVVATTNREKVHLSITEWEYGKFKESVNKPAWELEFGDDYTKYKFTLQYKEDPSIQYFYFGNPASNAVVESQGRSFNDAPAGEYILYAEAEAGDEYGEIKVSCDVTVHKANITFSKVPYVSGWTYGTLTGNSLINPEIELDANISSSVLSDIVVRYSKVGGDPVPRLSGLVDSKGYVPVGDYYIILSRAEKGNYETLNYTIKFSVLRAQNYWDEYPTIESWTYGEFVSTMLPTEFKPHFGDGKKATVEYRVKGSETWGSFEDLPRTNGQLEVGSYEMRVTMDISIEEQKNFTPLDVVIVSFTVRESSTTGGTVNPQPASEGGVSNGAAVAVIIVFAVVAVALAGLWVAVALIAKKKANAEYIKTVKSEMKRR